MRYLLLLCVATAASAQQPRLGTVHFPTSAQPAAQQHFLRGVGFLHSFEYDAAAQAFREAQRAEPGFALAYWGEAMTLNHPVWNQQATDSARTVLARLAPTREQRLARAGTPQERAWLGAVEILYGEGSKPRRDTLYARAMLSMVEEYPADHEMRAFAALALLGLNQAIRDVPAYMRAAALVQPVFEANPDHPGAVHYLIHAYDDPVHAPLGLRAAQAYSRIAPDAAHAQHMTTHIFFALGMWDEGRAQNEVAVNLTRWAPGHYTWWLGYALLQQGRFADAERHIERVRGGLNPASRGQLSHLTWMRGDYVVNTERWHAAPAQWPVANAAIPAVAAFDDFVTGYRAMKLADSATARTALRSMGTRLIALRNQGDTLAVRPLVVLERELRALFAVAEGRMDDAVAILREAAGMEEAIPAEFGPPIIVKPAWELLGEVLLEARRPAEAQRAFTRAQELAPGRARSLMGLVRAAAAAGDMAVAEAAYRKLEANWRLADRDLQDLAELRRISGIATR